MLTIIFGLVIGSFLNVLIYRLPRGESIVLPPSHCPCCQHRLGTWDLFPVLSYLFLGGKCRYCRAKISLQYPLIEVLAAFCTWIWWRQFGQNELTVANLILLVFTYVLLVVAVIDLEQQVIPDKLTYPMIVLGLFSQAWAGFLPEAVLGMVVGAGVLFLITIIYPRGLGFGDVKFMAMAGVFLGWQKVIINLFLGSCLGVIIIVPLLLLKRVNRRSPFAFGPFLATATFILIYGWNPIHAMIHLVLSM